MFLLKWENFTSTNFLGFSDRCQYLEYNKVWKSDWFLTLHVFSLYLSSAVVEHLMNTYVASGAVLDAGPLPVQLFCQSLFTSKICPTFIICSFIVYDFLSLSVNRNLKMAKIILIMPSLHIFNDHRLYRKQTKKFKNMNISCLN